MTLQVRSFRRKPESRLRGTTSDSSRDTIRLFRNRSTNRTGIRYGVPGTTADFKAGEGEIGRQWTQMNALLQAATEASDFMGERRWRAAGREMERIRREALRGMPYRWEDVVALLELGDGCETSPRFADGLVEMQRWFLMFAKTR